VDRAKWCFICGRVTAQRVRLLDRRAVLAIAQAPTVEDRRARLRSSLLFSETPPGERPFEEVEERFAGLARETGALSPDARVAALLEQGSAWTAAREAIRAEAAARLGVSARSGSAPPKGVRGDADAIRESPEFAEARYRVLDGSSPSDEAESRGDRILDAYEAAALLRVARDAGGDPLGGWVAAWVRLRGALAFVRARTLGWNLPEMWREWRAAGVDFPALGDLALGDEATRGAALNSLGLFPPSENANIAALERRVDERMTEVVSAARGEPFGPEVVFAFLWALRIEALNLRIALAAAESGMSERRMAEELRTEAA